jgi:GT2 family glycosyltransferase
MINKLAKNKSPMVIIITLSSWLVVSYISWESYIRTIPKDCVAITWIFLHILPVGWLIFWLWGLHNFWHQTISLLPFSQMVNNIASSNKNPSVVILYTTCDDFDSDACNSCINQNYQKTKLIICDDSKDENIKNRINAWVNKSRHDVTIVRRRESKGFKAGNINNAILNYVNEEFIVICDADEVLPSNFVEQLLHFFIDDEIGFVQASHHSRLLGVQSKFASILSPSIDIFYRYTLPLRNKFGFVSCFGTGVMIRRKAWNIVGGFPEIVSEDLGFATRLLSVGLRGVFVPMLCAEEAHPQNYKAFVTKYRKVIGGTVEFFQKEFYHLLKSKKATLTELIDISLTFSFCYIGIITTFNVIGAIVLSIMYGQNGDSAINLSLIWLYLIGPLTPVVPLIIGLMKKPKKFFNYLIVSSIAHVSLIPKLTLKCIEQTLNIRPTIFEVTGKTSHQPQHLREHTITIIVGLILLAISTFLIQTKDAPLTSLSVMILIGPLLSLLGKKGLLGWSVQICCVIPYLLLLYLLI